MSGVRALLTRVAKLEAARVTPKSPIEVTYGSMEAFADRMRVDVASGKLDGIDAPALVNALLRWHKDQVWAGWRHHRNGMWDCR